MSDIEKAKGLLAQGYTCVLCRGGRVITSNEKGITPMVGILDGKTDVKGFSAADKVVGRAAALLFVLAGIEELYAEVISEGACELLRDSGVAFAYKIRTDRIINRKGTGVCPMEAAVDGISSPAQAYGAIKRRLEELKREKEKG